MKGGEGMAAVKEKREEGSGTHITLLHNDHLPFRWIHTETQTLTDSNDVNAYSIYTTTSFPSIDRLTNKNLLKTKCDTQDRFIIEKEYSNRTHIRLTVCAMNSP